MNPVNAPPVPPSPYFAATEALEADETPQDHKRKKEEDDTVEQSQQPQIRSKRNRYISIACNECKRRKIKCNGQNPCQRCGNLRLSCIYAPNCCSSSFKDSEEYKEMSAHLQSLQQQVNELYEHVTALRNTQAQFPMHPALVSTDPTASFRGNTSPGQPRIGQASYQGATVPQKEFDMSRQSTSNAHRTDSDQR